MSLRVAARSHGFGKVEPQFGVLGIRVVPAFLVGEVGQHSAAEFAFLETQAEFRQAGREGIYMMVVILGVVAEIVTRQLACAPGFVEGVAEQIEGRDAGIELLEEFLSGHLGLSFLVCSLIYGRAKRVATGRHPAGALTTEDTECTEEMLRPNHLEASWIHSKAV